MASATIAGTTRASDPEPPPPKKKKRPEKKKVIPPPYLTSGSWKDAVRHPSRDSPNTSRRFALVASNVCLAGENPTCSVPA